MLEEAFADLAPLGPIEPLGSGFNSHAVAAANGRVIRIGQTREAAAGYALEASVLPELRRQLGFCVPEFLGYSAPGCQLPFGAICTSRLPGRHPEWSLEPPKSLMSGVGAFVASLHALPLSPFRAQDVPRRNPLAKVLAARARLMPLLRNRLSAGEVRQVERWWNDLEIERREWSWQPGLSHTDLWHENLLVDEHGNLCGVLDWSSLAVSDPAADFAPIKYFGAEAFNVMVEYYTANGGTWSAPMAHRSQRYFEGRELEGLLWSIDHEDQAEAEDSITKLRRGPILN